ncbi:MAG: glycosyltransferase [Anaerolineaceae bacterium]|nr:glycosyltransferase [Anaerolineaceae bacterium]
MTETSETSRPTGDAPGVTVICLNYKGQEVLPACLESLRKQSYPNVQVIVVENAGGDRSAEIVRQRFPEVELIENDENLGFGGGNNVGLAAVRTPLVMMLNNDTELDPDCIAEMVRVMESDVECGSVASKILLKFNDLRIDAAGIEICPDGLALGRGRWREKEELSEEAEVFFVSDCCGLYRMAMVESIRLPGFGRQGWEIYDEDFFAYADETDLGWRARLAGWKSLYAPQAVCYHCHSASTGSVHPQKVYWVERNRIWVAVKSFPLWLLGWGALYMVARYWWQAWGVFSGKGRAGEFRKEYSAGRLALVLVKAWLGAFAGLPKMLRKRRAIGRRRRIGHGQIRSLLKRFGIPARSVALRD